MNRGRLASLFGVRLDPLTSARPDVLARICAEYAAAAAGDHVAGAGAVENNGNKNACTRVDVSGTERVGWRVARRVDGTLVPAALLTPLRCVLAWHYFTIALQADMLYLGTRTDDIDFDLNDAV